MASGPRGRYSGWRAVHEAWEAGVLRIVQAAGKRVLFVTNSASRHRSVMAGKLRGLGMPDDVKSCYTSEMPYTNYTHDFTGIIDYIFCSPAFMRSVAVHQCEHHQTTPQVSDHNAVRTLLVRRNGASGSGLRPPTVCTNK